MQSVTSQVMFQRPKQPVAFYPKTRATSYKKQNTNTKVTAWGILPVEHPS